jgi:ferritin-like metal-binding protein YciE
MAKMKSLEDLFINLLKDMYYSEQQILRALPKMAKKAESDELRLAFEHHRKETEDHVERLEQVRDFPILSGFPNHANSASPLLIVRWGEDHGTSLQPGFA